jgi:uncharacterized membrane protein
MSETEALESKSGRGTLGALGVGLLGALALSWLDQDLHEALHFLAFHGDLDAARDLLANLLALSVTAVSVLVSITMSIVQGAAGQFSPRLVGPLLARVLPPSSLVLYVGAVAYTMVLLYLAEGVDQEAPRVSVTLAMVLTFASTLVASAQLLRAMWAIRVEDLMRWLGKRARAGNSMEGLRLLSDIGLRALSPAVNDPYTAIQALDAAVPVLRDLGTACSDDVEGAAQQFERGLELVLGGFLRYGAGDAEVLVALAGSAHELREASGGASADWFSDFLGAVGSAGEALGRAAERGAVERAVAG